MRGVAVFWVVAAAAARVGHRRAHERRRWKKATVDLMWSIRSLSLPLRPISNCALVDHILFLFVLFAVHQASSILPTIT
jgi:hypothetical protein